MGDVREKYKVNPREIGHGHYGVVRKCVNRETGVEYAIKSIKKSKVGRLESLIREINILRTVHHPNILSLVDVYEDEKFLHLVTELCTGGELFDRIIAKTNSEEGRFTEQDAAKLVQQILSAIEYCHNVHNICHRDLKPENFLFKTSSEDAELKVIDFGLSRFDDMEEHMHTRVGTPYYIAPEVLQRDYDKACDMWSIGVITYILLCGFPPFYGNSDQEIFMSIQRGVYDYPSPEWDSISDDAKDFIDSLLKKDPSERPTASEAAAHRWFTSVDALPTVVISENIKHSLSRFMGMSKLKKVALSVIANKLTEAEIGNLSKIFHTIDTDGSGTISIDELREALDNEGLEMLEDEIGELMSGLDIDGNNELDYSEFLAATMNVNLFIREDNIRHAFDYFDSEGSGFIDMDVLVNIFGSEEHAREVVGQLDQNGDGKIDFEEFKAMMVSQNFISPRDPLPEPESRK
jgi:calcium-dependent protein kinase